jgi:hypothetical protein
MPSINKANEAISTEYADPVIFYDSYNGVLTPVLQIHTDSEMKYQCFQTDTDTDRRSMNRIYQNKLSSARVYFLKSRVTDWLTKDRMQGDLTDFMWSQEFRIK